MIELQLREAAQQAMAPADLRDLDSLIISVISSILDKPWKSKTIKKKALII